ncbi:High potential iron-sulfur protein [Trinickia violacea]|uniref:High-potential iron-sulfur protein n=1 Tax=Trinickia violacea TaxID=2571746 RepID=A0A4P8IZA4_9BURK|nr:high-potential iron-sulfur protein [Trinickia violacea]QCP52913.1 High potential iron-sulfur protein [Trinickia violacea]
MKASRRSFLIASVGIGSSLILAQRVGAAEQLSESDPQALSYGYQTDASKVDKSKYATYQAGQECANCSLYSGKAGAPSGGCVLFGAKEVAAHGWCSAYTNS